MQAKDWPKKKHAALLDALNPLQARLAFLEKQREITEADIEGLLNLVEQAHVVSGNHLLLKNEADYLKIIRDRGYPRFRENFFTQFFLEVEHLANLHQQGLLGEL